MADRPVRIAIVSPCYNEQDVIGAFYSALAEVLSGIPDVEFRVLFIDDGSRDETLPTLNRIAAVDSRVEVYSFTRNFGHQAALSAGLDHASGDAVILLDSDLQHPPQLIPRMIEQWRQGSDVVAAVREQSPGAGLIKRWTSSGFYRLFNLLSETKLTPGAADFFLLSRAAYRALRHMPERHRFLRGMVAWVGYERTLIPYTAAPRGGGGRSTRCSR